MDSDKKILLTLCIIAIILGVGLYMLVKQSQKRAEDVAFDYNGFLFRKAPIGYKVQIFVNRNKEPSFFTVRSDPRELENIPVDKKINELKDKKQIYVVIDPYENLTGVTTMAALELENVIENQFLFNIPVNSAFVRDYPGKGIGVKTCKDANETVAIIWLRLGESTRVAYEDKCIILESPIEDDLIKAADKITLTLLGIMKQ